MSENNALSTLCRMFNSIADTAEIIDRHISDIKKVNNNEEIAPHNDILSTLCRMFNSIADTSEIIEKHIRDIKKVNNNEEIAPKNVIAEVEKLNEEILNRTKWAANELFWAIMAKRKQQVEQGLGE